MTVLAAADIHAHNTFDQPSAVQPREESSGSVADGVVTCRLPAASVSRISIGLT